jgi:hypothetical protein
MNEAVFTVFDEESGEIKRIVSGPDGVVDPGLEQGEGVLVGRYGPGYIAEGIVVQFPAKPSPITPGTGPQSPGSPTSMQPKPQRKRRSKPSVTAGSANR